MQNRELNTDWVNFTWSTDWHLSAVPPGRRADDYQQAILDKLAFIRDLTHKVGGVALAGGDVFHIKSNKHPANSLSLLASILRSLRTFPLGCVYGSVGNHDLALGERMESLSSQPLGVLIAAGAYFNLSEEPVIFANVPGTIRVSVESFPYDHADGTLRRILASKRHPKATHRIAIVHAYGEPGGGGDSWGERTIGYNQVEDTDFDFMLWGHDHSRKETQKVGHVTHVHLGSLARAALDTDQTERPVTVAVMSFQETGIKYKEITVPVKPLEEAFVVADKAVRTIEKTDDMKEFLAKMDEAVSGVEAASDPGEALRLLCPDDPPLLALARELCSL